MALRFAEALARSCAGALGEAVAGVFLHGSLVLDDYVPGRSDVDLLVAVDSRDLIERAKGALMEREHLDAQEAFTHLRRAARSSGRKLSDVAREAAAGLPPLPRGRTKPPETQAKPTRGDTGTPTPKPDA
jgi:predicted nucleotidyltransferase